MCCGAARRVERVVFAAPVAVDVLLDPAPALAQCVAGQADTRQAGATQLECLFARTIRRISRASRTNWITNVPSASFQLRDPIGNCDSA